MTIGCLLHSVALHHPLRSVQDDVHIAANVTQYNGRYSSKMLMVQGKRAQMKLGLPVFLSRPAPPYTPPEPCQPRMWRTWTEGGPTEVVQGTQVHPGG